MYSIAISLGAGLLVALLVTLWYPWYAAIFPGLLVALLLFFTLARRFLGTLQDVANESLKHLEKQRFDKAVQVLEDGKKHKKWMILVESQLDGQIGYIHYLRKEFKRAQPYLARAFVRNWMAHLMLASCHFRNKSFEEMVKVLEKVANTNKKEPLVWGVYAYLLVEAGQPDKAIEVLGRGLKINEGDKALEENLLNLQNKKKLKLARFGDMWYQLHFETPPMERLVPNHPRFQAMRRR